MSASVLRIVISRSLQIDRLGDEIEGAAIHRGAQIRHVAVGRDDDRPHRRLPLAQFVEQGQPVHHRHVDVEQHQLDIRFGCEHRQRLLAVVSEAEFELLVADLAAKALPDQELEIRLVVDREYLG